MNKMPIYAVAAAALFSTAALAQQATPAAPPSPTAPAARVTPPPAAGPATMGAAFVDRQAADQFLASDLIGMTVHGAGDEQLGEINDLLLNRDGSIQAAVIGVGGFLGLGEKNVAVAFPAVEVTRTPDGKERLVLRRTKDELKSAPDFAKYERPAPAATGSVTTPKPAAPAAPASTR